MAMTLERREYLWAVAYESRDDGHRVTAAVFTDREEAERFRKEGGEHNSAVVQTSLWYCPNTEKYFEAKLTTVPVDNHTIRQRALAKLTAQERDALGV